MPRIPPLDRNELPAFEPVFKDMEDALGYVPNSFFTMGRVPEILKAVGGLMDGFWYSETVSEPVRRLVTFAYSWFSGSPYSAAHCACGSEELGLSLDKINAIDDFETSTLFSEPEKCLLRLCHNAANIPGRVTDDDLVQLDKHYSEEEILFVTGLISCMAFLNKWNEIVQTTLEPVPQKWASENLVGFNSMQKENKIS